MTVERLTWSEAAKRLEGYTISFNAIEFGVVVIGEDHFSIAPHKRDDDTIYVRADASEPATHCLLSRDRDALIPKDE